MAVVLLIAVLVAGSALLGTAVEALVTALVCEHAEHR